MILPEHKEELQAWRRRRERRSRPELDEYLKQRIDAVVNWSLRTGKPVAVRVYDPYEDQIVTGVVERVDRLQRRVWISGEWVNVKDITEVDGPGE